MCSAARRNAFFVNCRKYTCFADVPQNAASFANTWSLALDDCDVAFLIGLDYAYVVEILLVALRVCVYKNVLFCLNTVKR
jgi:hypothetical protein